MKGAAANVSASSFVNLPPGPMGGAANRPFSAGLGMGATADPAKHSLPSGLVHDEHLYNVKVSRMKQRRDNGDAETVRSASRAGSQDT